jgi:uncharacterized membrane protein
MSARLRRILRWALAVFFVAAGTNHFINPDLYLAVIPPILPAPRALVFISGFAEIVGGLAVLLPSFRKLAGWGLVILLVAVFPANIYMAMEGLKIGAQMVPPWVLWARLPLQFVLIVWVWVACHNGKQDELRPRK